MSTILIILQNNFSRIFSKKGVYIQIFLIPILLISLSIYMNSKIEPKLNIGIIEKEHSSTSKDFINLLQSTKNINVKNVDTDMKNSSLIINKYDFIITIPNGFEKKVSNLRNNIEKPMIDNLLNFEGVRSKKLLDKGKDLSYYYILNNKPLDISQLLKNPDEKLPSVLSISIGFILIFLFANAISYSNLLIEDKENNILLRFKLSPNKLYKYILANSMSTFLIVYIQSLFSILVAKYIFNVNIGTSMVNILIYMILVCICCTLFGIAITTLVNNANSASIVGSATIIISSLLSGTIISLNVPKGIDILSRFFPQRYIINGVIGLEAGDNLWQLFNSQAYILIFICIFFFLSIYSLKKNN